MAESILLVDDDPLLLDAVRFSLERANYNVICAAGSAEALTAARQHRLDLAILDIGLPQGNGLHLCRSLQAGAPLPVIFLTAHDREMDVILGFEHGADDYITKPFSIAELTARVGAVLRRARSNGVPRPTDRLEAANVVMDVAQHEVTVNGRLVELPLKQFELLRLLMSRPGEVIERQAIIDAIWGEDYFGDTRVLDVHIRWLRKFIEPDPSNPRYVITIRGVGYKFHG